MHRIKSLAVLTLLVVLALTPGCIKFKQVVTVMPDGSGKIEMRIGLSQQLIELAKEQGEDPFKEMVPEAMAEKAQGIVAYTEPKRETQGNFSYISFSMYFPDINKVKLGEMGDGEPAEFTYTREGDTAKLTIKNGTLLSMLKDYEPSNEPEKAQLKQAMAGLAFSEHYVLPGTFKDVPGVAGVDNTAKLDLSLDNLLEGTGPIKELKGKDTLTFEVTDVTVTDDQIAAFRKEMDEAAKAWEAKKKQAKDAE